MLNYFNKLEKYRDLLLELTTDLTVDQYNLIPPGFNNNIIWNMGHILVVGKGLLHQKPTKQSNVDDTLNKRFQIGSRPDVFMEEKDILFIRDALKESAKHYKLYANHNELTGNNALSTSVGSPVISDDSMRFLLFYEQMHYQKITKLMDMVKK